MRKLVAVGVVIGFLFEAISAWSGYPNGPVASPTLIALAAILCLLSEEL